ncbi:MAG: MFS transporter [Coriobacteriaceae bacterium]|jgi:MFS family permease|nr:MFS transporter [Coriobacteriaceae bacterium]
MSQDTTKAPGPRYAWAVLGMTFLFSVASAMLWFSTTAVTDGFIAEYIFKLGPENIGANIGLLMTDVAIAALIAALFCFFFQDRLGVKAIMVIGSVLVLGGMLTAALSGSDFNLLRASRYIGGLGIGCAATSSTTAISLWFSDKNRALAMAIWAIWVPVAMIINYVVLRPFALAGMVSPDEAIGSVIAGNPGLIGEHGPDMAQVMPSAIPLINAPNIHLLYWVGATLAAIAFVLLLLFYRNPAQGHSAVSIEKTPFKEALRHITKRRVIALLFCMFFFTFVSNCFTTYNVDFFTTSVDQGGQGMDQATAGLVAVVASAFGVFAPVFGVISDKMHPNRKYLLLVFSAICYTVAAVFGFKAWGLPLLVVYLVFTVLAMASANASIRPALPLFVKQGGISAITLGLAALTFLEFFGQIFTVFVGMAKDAFATVEGGVIVNAGYEQAAWFVALPAAVILIVCAVLTRPGKADLAPSVAQEEPQDQ